MGTSVNAASRDFEDDTAVPPAERRDLMAYDLWTRCHQDGAVPSQQELLGHQECDFVDHSVLIRIVGEDTAPIISHIGTQLWLGLDGILPQDISEVPARSVLSRITEHYLEAVANRTAVGFEAEFVNEDGSAIGYRAIALPCASDGDTIDAVLGVVDYTLVEEEPLPAPEIAPEQNVATEAGDMPREGWRSVIANMRREPGEPVADEEVEAEQQPEVEPVSPDAPKLKKRKRQALDPLPAESAAEEDIPPPPATGKTTARDDAIRTALGQLLEIEGALAAALVEIESGMPLASVGEAGGMDLDIAVAGNTEMLRAKRKAIRAIGMEDEVEDVIVTLFSQYHLLRPLGSNDGLFLCVVLDRKAATLAMARHELRRVEGALSL